MNQPELQQFARQLSIWTELIIENGRTPFRRVELYPELHTDQGILQPPLVFWINRQSMMAGGILLLPEHDLKAELKRGRSCCQALGLKHFVTWENDCVRIWELAGDDIHQHLQLDLKNADRSDSFRHLLGELLEALKLLAVIGLSPAHELTTHYLHNLFSTTLNLGLPALVNSYRNQRAEEELNAAEDADQLANEANRLLLLQLLSLAWHQQLPTAILPEKLERAIQLSLPQLPEPLRNTLALNVTTTPPSLPHETAVCFHHLLLRLRQLSWRQPEQRAIDCIQQMITHWDNERPLPQPYAEVQLYPQAPALDDTTQQVLSDSPSLLAATGLQLDLLQRPQKKLQLGNLFQLNFAGTKDLRVNAILTRERPLTREERQQYITHLRTSWPNRRFRIGTSKPLWYWELIHLLGLCKDQQSLHLTLPVAALQSPLTEPFWPLLQENYSIQQITSGEDNLVSLKLIPEANQDGPIRVVLDEQIRILPPTTELLTLRQQILLALQLPAEIYQRLTDKLIWPADEELDDEAKSGLQIFTSSRLWKLLNQIFASHSSIGEPQTLSQTEIWPRPDNLHLKELARLGETSSDDADQLLNKLLQIPVINANQETSKKPRRTNSHSNATDKALEEKLVGVLQQDGLPSFPEKYLYFLEQAELTTYQLTPPLKIKSELLGEIELEDASGQTLRVYGEELSNALLLCAQLGKTRVELPTDRQQMVQLLQQYRDDLKQLRKQLNSLCHSHLENPKVADKLTKKIWKRLNLPKQP